MEYITTTQLRTNSSQLVASLLKGTKISLIHRSKIVGIIQPPTETAKPFDAKKFEALVKELGLAKTSDQEREERYRSHLTKKYGKNIS
jgi:hypothetical protein